jgi:AcrR family transcriptional regulator
VPRSRETARAPDPRKRRTAEEARAEILDAAERRLVAAGPAGIRLQDVAADVGVSHPTVLHHFGSRDALVREVCERRFAAIHADLVRALASTAGSPEEVGVLLDAVFHALEAHGHGRVVFWLALEGLLDKGDELRIHELGLAAHAIRTKRRKGRKTVAVPVHNGGSAGSADSAGSAPKPPLEDTLHTVVLITLALLAESVVGKAILRDAGLGDDRTARARFRAFLARLVADHLESGPRS